MLCIIHVRKTSEDIKAVRGATHTDMDTDRDIETTSFVCVFY